MGQLRSTMRGLKFLGATGVALAILAGCSGKDGEPGSPGTQGVLVAPVTDAKALNITVDSATVASPTVVRFTVTDQSGNRVTGLTAGDIRLTLAKLVPGTYGNPGAWQSYVNTTATGAAGTATQATREGGTTGAFAGTLTDNGDGTYAYQFKTDITNVTSPVAVSYNPGLTHRVGIQTRGAIPAANAVYTFRPADGATTGLYLRDIVKTEKCNQCHSKLTLHDQRIETKYCVTCHNPGSSDPDTGNTVDFKVMIHKIHRGEFLPSVEAGGKYQIIGFGGTVHDYSHVAFPQDIRNCTKCHDGADAGTPQGDNWKTVPSAEACGSCHDNVNFATGAGHAGGIKDNSTCAGCHSKGGMVGPVEDSHLPVTPPNPGSSLHVVGGSSIANAAWIAGFADRLPTGAIRITYDVSGVSAWKDGGGVLRPRIVFKFKQTVAGVTSDVVFNAFGSGKTELIDGFTGSPSAYFVWAIPQDNIISPADFNVSASGYIKRIWNGANAGTLTGPDGSGYYTLTLTGTTIPANATMLTGGIGFTYSLSTVAGTKTLSATNTQPLTQTNLAAPYNYDFATNIGGLIVQAPVVWKTATGYTARRNIVESTRCFACHAQLGVNPTFHAGQRNDAQACNWCHRANQTSSGWSARSTSFVHAIHGAAKRTQPFNWHATSATGGYQNIGFPGILKECDTCHMPGTYDYSAGVYTDTLLSNQLYTTAATGTFSTTPAIDNRPEPYKMTPTTGNPSYVWTLSPYVTLGTPYGASVSTATNPASTDATNLVTSPIATVCFACHDGDLQKAHMESYGGSIYRPRNVALAATEQCMMCHGPGKIAAIGPMHAK